MSIFLRLPARVVDYKLVSVYDSVDMKQVPLDLSLKSHKTLHEAYVNGDFTTKGTTTDGSTLVTINLRD